MVMAALLFARKRKSMARPRQRASIGGGRHGRIRLRRDCLSRPMVACRMKSALWSHRRVSWWRSAWPDPVAAGQDPCPSPLAVDGSRAG